MPDGAALLVHRRSATVVVCAVCGLSWCRHDMDDCPRCLIADLRILLPYEKPEQGPLPGWIVALKERVAHALKQKGGPA